MKEGTCKHFTGMHNKTCAKGVNYREHVGGPDLGWGCRMPCITKFRELGFVPCDSYDDPTAIEIAAFEAHIKAFTDRIKKTFPLIAEVKREHKGKDWQGVKPCPVCGGELHLSISAYNGHVWGKCKTPGCVAWME